MKCLLNTKQAERVRSKAESPERASTGRPIDPAVPVEIAHFPGGTGGLIRGRHSHRYLTYVTLHDSPSSAPRNSAQNSEMPRLSRTTQSLPRQRITDVGREPGANDDLTAFAEN